MQPVMLDKDRLHMIDDSQWWGIIASHGQYGLLMLHEQLVIAIYYSSDYGCRASATDSPPVSLPALCRDLRWGAIHHSESGHWQ